MINYIICIYINIFSYIKSFIWKTENTLNENTLNENTLNENTYNSETLTFDSMETNIKPVKENKSFQNVIHDYVHNKFYNVPLVTKLVIDDKTDNNKYRIVNCVGSNCSNILFYDGNVKVSLCNKCINNL